MNCLLRLKIQRTPAVAYSQFLSGLSFLHKLILRGMPAVKAHHSLPTVSSLCRMKTQIRLVFQRLPEGRVSPASKEYVYGGGPGNLTLYYRHPPPRPSDPEARVWATETLPLGRWAQLARVQGRARRRQGRAPGPCHPTARRGNTRKGLGLQFLLSDFFFQMCLHFGAYSDHFSVILALPD